MYNTRLHTAKLRASVGIGIKCVSRRGIVSMKKQLRKRTKIREKRRALVPRH